MLDRLGNLLHFGFEVGDGAVEAFQPRPLGIYLPGKVGVAAAGARHRAICLPNPLAHRTLAFGCDRSDAGNFLIRRIGLIVGTVGFGDAAFQFHQAIALFEPCRSGRAGFRLGDEAVPAPQIAVAVDQTLAGLQLGRQALTRGGVVDDADLRQAAGQRTRLVDEFDQRPCAGR